MNKFGQAGVYIAIFSKYMQEGEGAHSKNVQERLKTVIGLKNAGNGSGWCMGRVEPVC
jgi:hypothetical protein